MLLTWNAGNCCGYAFDQSSDDVGFLRALVDQLKAPFPLDLARVRHRDVQRLDDVLPVGVRGRRPVRPPWRRWPAHSTLRIVTVESPSRCWSSTEPRTNMCA